MAWDIGLNPLNRSQHLCLTPFTQRSSLRTLGIRLLLSYLGAMVVVMGVSAGAVYQFFAHSLSQRLDSHLTTIADAAKHNFSAIQHYPTAAQHRLPNVIDQDGDLDLPWQDLHSAPQTVEWFDATGNRLSFAGKLISSRPFVRYFQPLQQGSIRSLTSPIATGDKPIPQGYVRVSMSSREVDEDLRRLLVGLGIGGTVAIALIGLTGWWLTRRSLQPIERSMAKLQQFTADASHELRSPIAAIKTTVDVLQRHPERVHLADIKKLQIIGQATQHMTQLIDDLLLLARTDHDIAEKVHLRPIALHELLEEIGEDIRIKTTAVGLTLHIEVLCKCWVLGNGVQLSRVFLNLLDNAIKYTSFGGSIYLSLTQNNGVIQVRVTDTGIGIASDQLPRIFDRFWRADPSRSRKVGGSGLGLAIAQAILEAHHGKITVKSQLGQGSCFLVELPSASLSYQH